ncbi:MAG: hypothetical protein WEB06_03655 [Actinomycetota bacterium]
MKAVRERGTIGSLLFVLILAAVSGSAYIDAGSGSYILQLVIGGAVGAAMAVVAYWRRIRAAVGRRLSRKG